MWVYISLLLLMTVFPTMGGLSFGFVMSRPLLLSEISPVYWISLPVGVWGGNIRNVLCCYARKLQKSYGVRTSSIHLLCHDVNCGIDV